MTGKKIGKVLLVWLCIITLLMPFGSEVLAAALTGNEDSTVVLESIPYREGGPESTGTSFEHYDQSSYSYKIAEHNVLKVIQKDDATYADTFYCVNGERSLSITSSYDYSKASDDFTKLSDSEVRKWADSVGISEENFNSLVYLLKNIYAKKLDTSYKDAYIEKAFAEKIAYDEENGVEPATTVDLVKEYLTDDDIEVVQQWAIWYFTNGTNTENEFYSNVYTSFGSVEVSKFTGVDPTTHAPIVETQDLSRIRQEYAGILYEYLIESAKEHKADVNTEKTYPTIDKTTTPQSVVDGNYYKVGPFKVKSGNTITSDFVASIKTEGANLSDVAYKVTENGNDITSGFTNKLNLDKEYYIYLPIQNNTITKVTLDINYTTMGDRKITLWTGVDDSLHLQPLVLLTQEPGEPAPDSVSVNIVNVPYDLALRKFIVSVNGTATTGRTPVPTADSLEKLANGNVQTAEYTHAKSPVAVKKGDRVVYEFRIYNEGDINAKVQKIVDYLPDGVTVVDKSVSTVNSKANWIIEGNKITNTSLADTEINAFNKATKELSFGRIQVECEITGDLTEGTVLTNVGEIILDNGSDRDSDEGSIDPTTIPDNYSGNTSNKDDLTDTNYHYKGLQDDDDFEKVIIAGKQFDLSLQKFVSEVNGEDQKRAPSVDVTPLKNGADDAKYTASKNPVTVETGDIVTFTLRVYNEGEIDGYAETVTDYIPEGLGFLVNYNTNYNNRWAISENSQSKKLSEIKNGTNNLKLSDFKDVESLSDVEVVLGKSKITSTALASSSTSTTNLIKAFDGTTLSYKDIQVSFIVVTEDEVVLKNIAAITKESDKDRNPIETDRGPGKDSTPVDDIDPDKYTTGNEDDDDYDVVKTDKKDFDLALQKFISGLNDKEVTDRVPVVSVTDGKIKYTHPKSEAMKVGNGDLITYTLRVYNEGDIDGYAAEIEDDIPTGLVFVTDNSVNQKYGWKMYDKSGNVTTDTSQAVKVKTTYLSKDSSDENVIKAFDGSTLMYKDVKLVFKVDESAIDKTVTTEKRTLINTAEISKNTDKDGKDIQDIDSTPGNNKPGEDDIDQEKVYVKYFDLALEKTLNKAVVTTNGETKEVIGDQLKIEIHRKNINSTSIQFVYTVKVTNQGEIEGYATEITDRIPEGLSFNKASNPDWTQVSDGIIKTDALAKTLLQPGESAEVKVILDWVKSSENIGRFVNVAEISEDWNPYDSDDVDSTPNNNVPTEDDQDDAPVWIGIVTGLGDQPFIILPTVVLVILATGVILIKKYVL